MRSRYSFDGSLGSECSGLGTLWALSIERAMAREGVSLVLFSVILLGVAAQQPNTECGVCDRLVYKSTYICYVRSYSTVVINISKHVNI